jgi:hypothetical protein
MGVKLVSTVNGRTGYGEADMWNKKSGRTGNWKQFYDVKLNDTILQ